MVAGCQNKAPAVLFVIPEDAWITEIRCARVFDHRVAIIFFKMLSLIQAVCNTLLLQARFHIVRRVDSHHRLLTVFRKSAGVIFIVCHTSGVHRSNLIRVQCDRQMLPVNQVFRYCMTPVHRSPYNIIWVMLIIQMPDTIDVNQSVRIVVPVFLRCKMNVRSKISFSLFTHMLPLFLFSLFLFYRFPFGTSTKKKYERNSLLFKYGHVIWIQHGHIWNFFSYRTLIANRLRYCFFVIAFRPIFSLLQKLLDLLRPGKSQPVRSNQRLPALSYRTPSLHHQRRRLPM